MTIILHRPLLFILLVLFCARGTAQNEIGSEDTSGLELINKWPKFYFAFGYHRAYFTPSTIQLQESSVFDFTLDKVKASDLPLRGLRDLKPFSYGPYHLRLGYRYASNKSIAMGFDHMRYHTRQNQRVEINGYYHDTPNGEGKIIASGDIELSPEFFRFEHTDGLNYLYIGHDFLLQVRGPPLPILISLGADAGLYIPRTESYIRERGGNKKYHLSGWGSSVHAHLQWPAGQRIVVEVGAKAGYINLSDILVGGSPNGRADQELGFATIQISGLYLF